jgi:hypothetical protein
MKGLNSVYGSIHEQIPVVKMFEENINKRENQKLENMGDVIRMIRFHV